MRKKKDNNMKIINNKVCEYIQRPGMKGVYRAVRDAAIICYQTDADKMDKTSKQFVDSVLLKNGHTRPLEFGTVYMVMPNDCDRYEKYAKNKWSVVNRAYDGGELYITTNLRVIMQGDYSTDMEAFQNGYDRNWLEDANKYWCEPTEYHKLRRTFTMLMSRGCTDDYRTHIALSSICESTRYCNYSNDKFNNELTFIKPYWITNKCVHYYKTSKLRPVADRVSRWGLWSRLPNWVFKIVKPFGVLKYIYGNGKNGADKRRAEIEFLDSMQIAENVYMDAAAKGLQPQQLKRLFPLGVKAELRLCGFDDAWQNFFWRRCDKHPDPECVEVAKTIKDIYS